MAFPSQHSSNDKGDATHVENVTHVRSNESTEMKDLGALEAGQTLNAKNKVRWNGREYTKQEVTADGRMRPGYL